MQRVAVRTAGAPQRAAGFTIVELMIAITIAALLAAFAVPSMNEFFLNQARTSTVNDLVQALHVARSDALSFRRSTRVCPAVSADSTDCADTRSYGAGWIVRPANTADCPQATCPRAYRYYNPQLGGETTFVADDTRFDFDYRGRLVGVDADTAAYARYCDRRGDEEARWVLVYPSGRASTHGYDGDTAPPELRFIEAAGRTCAAAE